jgi:phosphoribosyl 1,2-cyclic phosphodiesterase
MGSEGRDNQKGGIKIHFWGVRGSHPTPGPSTVKFGGNSSCVEMRAAGETLIFDAGTGIIPLGRELSAANRNHAMHVFLSHTHHDHIEGLRFFEPIYRSDWECTLYGSGRGARALARVLSGAMQPRFFPVSMAELPAKVSIKQLRSGRQLRLGHNPAVEVTMRHSEAHPKIGVNLYRITCGGKTVVYATDVESAKGGHEDVVDFARGADLLIHDAQYTDEEYYGGHINKSGWGHSTVRQAAEVAGAAGVGELILFHHDPSHDDAAVRNLEAQARAIFPRARAAYEGLVIEV